MSNVGFKGNVPHGIDFRCLRLPLGYEPPAAVLNEWKEKYNFDDVKVERDARRRELRILIVYGEKRDVDMGGFALHQLLAEEKGRKRSRDTDENCNDGGYPEKRQKAEKQSTPFAVPRNDTRSSLSYDRRAIAPHTASRKPPHLKTLYCLVCLSKGGKNPTRLRTAAEAETHCKTMQHKANEWRLVDEALLAKGRDWLSRR